MKKYFLMGFLCIASSTNCGHSKKEPADFRNTTINGAYFHPEETAGADFTNARLHSVSFEGADVSGANFSGARYEDDGYLKPVTPDYLQEQGAVNVDKAIF